MKRQNIFYSILLFGYIIALVISCEPDEPIKPNNPLNGRTTAVFNYSKTYGTVYDIDGNEYKTILIGSQTWMAENLRTTRYQNGDSIPNVTGNDDWAALETGAYCHYKNTTNLDTIATLGCLYNWYAAADARNIAPEGWHVPTDAEWSTLISFLGVDSVANVKLKEAGRKHWLIAAYGQPATNESGFTALPGGAREYYDGSFFNFFGGGYGFWWSITSHDASNAGNIGLIYYNPKYILNINAKTAGFSIRCIKDN